MKRVTAMMMMLGETHKYRRFGFRPRVFSSSSSSFPSPFHSTTERKLCGNRRKRRIEQTTPGFGRVKGKKLQMASSAEATIEMGVDGSVVVYSYQPTKRALVKITLNSLSFNIRTCRFKTPRT